MKQKRGKEREVKRDRESEGRNREKKETSLQKFKEDIITKENGEEGRKKSENGPEEIAAAVETAPFYTSLVGWL